jgi:hypothetical protein
MCLYDPVNYLVDLFQRRLFFCGRSLNEFRSQMLYIHGEYFKVVFAWAFLNHSNHFLLEK